MLLLIYYRLYTIESQEQDVSESELANFFQSIDRLESKDPTGTQARARAAINSLQNPTLSYDRTVADSPRWNPYGNPLGESGFWSFIVSRRDNPFRTFLEILWTRLAYTFDLPSDIFGEDLATEAVSPLMDARWQSGEAQGWEYRYTSMSNEQLSAGPDSAHWEPAEISIEEFIILRVLCAGKEVHLNDAELVEVLAEKGTTPGAVMKTLTDKNLAYTKGNRAFLLTDQCDCVLLPDGRGVAGENKTGRLTRWLVRYQGERKQGE